MITDELKDWLAVNAGIGGCYSPGSINYTDPDGIARQGSTGDVLNAFTVAHLVGKDEAVIIANTNYSQLKTINGNTDLTITDVAFVYNNDGDPAGEPKYCTGVPCVPDWQCEIPLNGYEFDGCGNRQVNAACNPVNGDNGDNDDTTERAGTHIFIGPPEGAPSIVLDLSNLEMRQNESDYHFEMNDIQITSTSPQKCYIALELRLFSGALDTCPLSGASFIGMDRVSTSRNVRIKVLDPGEIETINADFYQPEALRGVHTVCLLVHGTWTRTELESEVELISG